MLQPPILLSYFRVMDSTDWYGAASSRRPQSHPASPHSAWIIQLLLLLHPTFLPSYAMLFNLQSLLAAAARAGVIHIYTAICGRFPDSPSYFPSVSPTCWAGLGPRHYQLKPVSWKFSRGDSTRSTISPSCVYTADSEMAELMETCLPVARHPSQKCGMIQGPRRRYSENGAEKRWRTTNYRYIYIYTLDNNRSINAIAPSFFWFPFFFPRLTICKHGRRFLLSLFSLRLLRGHSSGINTVWLMVDVVLPEWPAERRTRLDVGFLLDLVLVG